MKKNLFNICAGLILLASFFYQCSDPHQRFEDPPWLGGTSIVTLEKEGNYTHFLALMDKAEYRTSIENQLFTLFVPNDSSFEVYFDAAGINSIDELTKDEAEELFGQHILINPRSRDQLMYEYAWGELQDPAGEYGTLFHKKRTYSTPVEYEEEVRYNEEFKGQTLKIYRDRTYLHLFTTEFFEDYGGDPDGSDYTFLYPNTPWSGTNWHDAMVTEAEVRTSSGFIYYLDRVVAPAPTIETYLFNHQEEFGLFYDVAQRFAGYGDADFNEQLERRYRKRYNPPMELSFANEYGSRGEGVESAMLYSFSAYVPYDHVMLEFFNRTIFQYYDDLDSVPELFLSYCLNSHLQNSLILPSQMENKFQNYYGDEIDLDIYTDIDETVMTCNGPIFKMNKFLEPNVFTCVPGPIFYNNHYTTFLYALDQSGLLTTLTQSDIDVTLFAADNELLLENGLRTTKVDGAVIVQVQSSDDLWHDMDQTDIEEFIQDYFHIGRFEDFQGEGYIRMASDNYVHYNAGQLASGGNQNAGDHCLVLEKIPSEINGNLFYLDNALKTPYNCAKLIMEDPDLSSFVDLLVEASLIDSVQIDYELPGVNYPRIKFIPDLKQWTVLAPSNQAIADAEAQGLIPEDVDELTDFLYYHFVRQKCVFDDGEFSGMLNTHLKDTVIGDEIFYEMVNFSNAIYDLSVEDGSGETISIQHSNANRLMESGVVHKITSVLKVEP